MSRSRVDYRQAGKDTWKKFLLENEGVEIDYLTFQNIIYTFNYGFRDYILETGNKAKLPWGFGDFSITKRKKKRTRIDKDGNEKINLSIDWKKTKEMGKTIYHFNRHTEGYNFKWQWFSDSARFFQPIIWNFKPSRVTSRLLTHYLNTDNYHLKYKQWDLVK